MKKTLLFLLTIFTISAATAQGNNLQFNQVKLVSNTEETVPVGKVWKITEVLRSTNGTTSASTPSIKVNGNVTYLGMAYNGPGTSPIWLPAGTTLVTWQYVNYISVIEFNIVQ